MVPSGARSFSRKVMAPTGFAPVQRQLAVRADRPSHARGRGRRTSRLVAIMIRFVGPAARDTDVARLLVGQLGQLRVELLELQARDLLVEVLRQGVDGDRILRGIGKELDLGDGLIGERGRHHVAWVAGSVAEVY